jgi:hypothetical protein
MARNVRRRRVWHWLADHGAPDWFWSLFTRSKWRRCSTCGLRGVGRWKRAHVFGGGEPSRHYCSTEHYYEREEF